MKLSMVMVAIALCSSLSFAAETKNPDKCLSLGFDVTRGYLSNGFPSNFKYVPASGTYESDSVNLSNTFMTADVRMPLNDWLTLTAHGGSWKQSAYQANAKGYTVGGGFRVYFQN